MSERICFLCGFDYMEYPCVVIDDLGLCDFCFEQWFDLVQWCDE